MKYRMVNATTYTFLPKIHHLVPNQIFTMQPHPYHKTSALTGSKTRVVSRQTTEATFEPSNVFFVTQFIRITEKKNKKTNKTNKV